MNNSIYIVSFLFINIICHSQTKVSKSNEQIKDETSTTVLYFTKQESSRTEKEVDWKKVDEFEQRMLNESIRNSGCRFNIKISPEEYLKYLNSPNPYTNKSNIKESY